MTAPRRRTSRAITHLNYFLRFQCQSEKSTGESSNRTVFGQVGVTEKPAEIDIARRIDRYAWATGSGTNAAEILCPYAVTGATELEGKGIRIADSGE